MKKVTIALLILTLCATGSLAAEFKPSLLKLTADPLVQYDFDGTEIEIPVEVSGSPAGIVLSIYTSGLAGTIPEVRNGYLDWHYVNQVDTCIYYSALKSVSVGKTVVNWDGNDQDGNTVPAGKYTYYMWAFDNQGTKQLVAEHIYPSHNNMIQETDAAGLPLANPIYFRSNSRWKIGSDPQDVTLLEESTLTLSEGWALCMNPCLDPANNDFFYIQVWNKEATSSGLQKFKWVPGGDSELQTDFGESGLSELFSVDGNAQNPGVVTDGEYLHTVWRKREQTDAGNAFYIYDYEGSIIESVDLSAWWSNPDDQAAGAQLNGGPNDIAIRNGKVLLNCHCSCLMQMVDPLRFLDTQEESDFYIWSNGNGDYLGDHNFEDTASLAWACMDFNVGPYTYTINSDDNLFTIFNAYDVGAVTFGLLGPDGTGMGYHAVAGETAGWKRGEVIIDSGTAYDGLYLDNMQTGGTHYEYDKEIADGFTYFLGHDSITGVITDAVGVADVAPAAFTVAQNSPNPFNPSTTISFTLTEANSVSVEIFNVAGQKIDTLADGFMDAGSQSLTWDASDISAGVYFYTVKSAGFSKTMKMTLLK